MTNKLRTKQCRRYMHPSNEDEFEFFDSPLTSINKLTQPKRGQYLRVSTVFRNITIIYRVTRRTFSEYLSAVLFCDLYFVLTTQRIQAVY